MKKIKPNRFVIVLLLISTAFYGYVEFANIHTADMTVKQKIIKAFYPVVMTMGKVFRRSKKENSNPGLLKPEASFYSLEAVDNNGGNINFEQFRGKKVLLVNTASECGYTPQYLELQELSIKFRNKLIIVGFPSNDFGEQEKGSDDEIARFCKKNYGISFPLARKSRVVKGDYQNKVFEWLSSSKENGWNDKGPSWNFSKYLVNEQGVLTHFFEPSSSPLGEEMLKALDE